MGGELVCTCGITSRFQE